MEPTHCPSCARMVVGETRSFCKHCLESFPEVDSRWASTAKYGILDLDHCWMH